MVTDVPYTDVSGKSYCLLVQAILLCGNTTDYFLRVLILSWPMELELYHLPSPSAVRYY